MLMETDRQVKTVMLREVESRQTGRDFFFFNGFAKKTCLVDPCLKRQDKSYVR